MDAELAELVSLKNLFQKELRNIHLQMKEFKTHLLMLVDDNRKLTKELKESIQYRISLTDIVDNISILEQKLHEAGDSKAITEKSLLTTAQEKGSGEKIVDSRDEELDKRIAEIQNHYRKGIIILNKELDKARSELTNLKQELWKKNNELEKNNTLIKKSQNTASENEKKLVEFKKKEQQLKEEILLMESDLHSVKKELKSKLQESGELRSNNEKLLSSNADLKKENMDLHKLLSVIKKDARASLVAAEQAIFQKSELILKEEYSQKRMQVLTASIDDSIRNVVFKYKDDAKRAIDKHVKEKQTLTNEIQKLQDENSENQSLLQKARRDNDRLNSMLQSLKKENIEQCIPFPVYHGLSDRLIACEKARDDAIFQQTILENRLKEIMENTTHDIEFHKLEAKCANEGLKSLKKTLGEFLPERTALTNEIEEKRNECEVLKKEIQFVRQLLQKEIDDVKEEMLIKTQAFNVQLKTVEENYMKRIKELEVLLTNQQEVSRKWKNIAVNMNIPSGINEQNLT